MHLFFTSQHLEHLLLGLVRVLDDDAPDKVDGARRGRHNAAADVGHRLLLEIVSKRTEPIVTLVSFLAIARASKTPSVTWARARRSNDAASANLLCAKAKYGSSRLNPGLGGPGGRLASVVP